MQGRDENGQNKISKGASAQRQQVHPQTGQPITQQDRDNGIEPISKAAFAQRQQVHPQTGQPITQQDRDNGIEPISKAAFAVRKSREKAAPPTNSNQGDLQGNTNQTVAEADSSTSMPNPRLAAPYEVDCSQQSRYSDVRATHYSPNTAHLLQNPNPPMAWHQHPLPIPAWSTHMPPPIPYGHIASATMQHWPIRPHLISQQQPPTLQEPMEVPPSSPEIDVVSISPPPVNNQAAKHPSDDSMEYLPLDLTVKRPRSIEQKNPPSRSATSISDLRKHRADANNKAKAQIEGLRKSVECMPAIKTPQPQKSAIVFGMQQNVRANEHEHSAQRDQASNPPPDGIWRPF